jgi:hypothetical protein
MNGNPEAVALLERAIAAVKGAETLSFEGRELYTTGFGRKMYEELLKLPVPVAQRKYISWACSDVNYARVEGSMLFGEIQVTKLAIVNRDGIWDVLPDCVVEVSTIFERGNLLGILPFFRLFSIPQYPYELSIDEVPGSREQLKVKGRLAAKPLDCEDDIASEFSYAVNTGNGHLCSLDETTFFGRTVHLVLDKLEFGLPTKKELFELPDRPRLTTLNMAQYVGLWTQGMMCQHPALGDWIQQNVPPSPDPRKPG